MYHPLEVSHAYRRAALETASPREHVARAHDRAIASLRRSVPLLGRGDLAAHKTLLLEGMRIVEQLPLLFDRARGGATVERLLAVYAYLGERLSDANERRDAEPIREVITRLETLRAAFRPPQPVAE